MSKSTVFLIVSTVGLLAGCGGSGPPSTANPGTPPPHGGALSPIPGDKGYVEVVKKAGTPRTGNASGEVAFYFLKEDSSPVPSPPTAGTLVLSKEKKIALVARDGGLATPDGPVLFGGNDPDGALEVEMDGKKMSIPIGVR